MADFRPLLSHRILASTLLVAACGQPLADAVDEDEASGRDVEAHYVEERSIASTQKVEKGASIDAPLSVEFLGRYATGIEGLESSGETAAIRNNRLYVTSAQAAALDIVDVSDPTAPELVSRVDLSVFGPAIQSVDVSKHGLVAVAVAGAAKTDPGRVILLSRDGIVLRSVRVGSLPDMVVFTHNGERLVVANEGEPDCYGAGCTDPLGSVSIIDVHPLRFVPRVRTVTFEGAKIPAGLRVSGPGASAAQDIEPEYISITKDNRKALVTLQENNAVAVIDLHHGRIESILPLGYKDFAAPPSTTKYALQELPSLGSTAAGQAIALGGFSGLHFEGRTPEGKLKFITHTDRGPNGEPVGGRRPFLLPGFAPEVVRLEVDESSGSITIAQRIVLKRGDGSPLTGLPNLAVSGGNASSAYNDEIPVDLRGNILALDPLGGDFEGIAVDTDGSFWLADEYRPAIYHFDATGTLIKRLVPIGSHAAAGLAVPNTGESGALGVEALPAALAQRRQNRGMEAISLQNGKLYAMVQSPIRNPSSLSNSALSAMKNVRLVEIDPVSLATRQFLYMMDNPSPVDAADTRADKIGDMTALPGRGFLVVERDDDTLRTTPSAAISKKIYAFNLTGATDISAIDTLHNGLSLDQMSAEQLAGVGVKPIAKVLHSDLVQAGYADYSKVEGVAVIDASTFAVINDNDFQVAGITIDSSTGTFTPDPNPEPTVLGIMKMNQGLDASDRDNLINIRTWPAYGMYMPDAIATYDSAGMSYFVTANEGDARDYEGFSEEARARSVKSSYPAIPEVANDSQLGRLTITTVPPSGDFSRPYVFGTRSFSIWNARTGAQVWDSGVALETIAATALPYNFNSNHEANDFDSRSDNKGPEPEGIAIGKIKGRDYAFVGLERIGGVVVYDITQANAPRFVHYLNARDFSATPVGPDSGAEVVKFVSAEHSPTKSPLLLVSHEISGTVAMYRLD